MMDFDCPLAFHHKKGEYIFDLREHFVFVCLFVFFFFFFFFSRGRAFHFCWLELVELFRLYLGVSLCILFF